MIEGRGAESHDCADAIALEREAEGCSWLRLDRMASSVTLSVSQGVDWASSGHLSALLFPAGLFRGGALGLSGQPFH